MESKSSNSASSMPPQQGLLSSSSSNAASSNSQLAESMESENSPNNNNINNNTITTTNHLAHQKSSNTNNNNNNKQLSESQIKDHLAIQSRIDEIISKLMDKQNLTKEALSNCILSSEEILFLINHTKILIHSQPLILRLSAGIKIFGDIHGQYIDLLRWFELFNNEVENTLFLGDYVDRGKNSIETICLLLAFKLKYPLTFFILRGNHETSSINRLYGFYDEVKRRYNLKLYKYFTELFKTLPVAALIEDKIFCCHGGLPAEPEFLSSVAKVVRPFEVATEGAICDLLWADPDRNRPGFHENERGVSNTFGPDVFEQFLERYDFDLMVRAHQVCEDGYEFFHAQSGVTIFSAPNYCGEFDNAGAALVVNSNLECSFRILTASPRDIYRSQYVMPTISQLKAAREFEKKNLDNENNDDNNNNNNENPSLLLKQEEIEEKNDDKRTSHVNS